jgi:predicted nuclease of predicted toxin-antitoxin system
MLFKVDENLHPDVVVLLQQRGHDAVSVSTQGLRGASDRVIADVCQRESRALVTLDLDFGDIRTYPPEQFSGLVVLRISNHSRPYVLRVVERMLSLLDREPLTGHLWIVEEHRVRIRHAEDRDNP